MLKYMIPALALLFVGACGSDKDGETGDTSVTGDDDDDDTDTDTDTDTPPAEENMITEILIPGCQDWDGTITQTWNYAAETNFWTGGNPENVLNAWEQSDNGWNEEVLLPSVDFDPEDPTWDYLEATVTPGAAEYIPNETTLFSCGVDGLPNHSNVYAIRVYDASGNLADCAIFTDRTDGDAVAELYAMELNPNMEALPAEINEANCTEW